MAALDYSTPSLTNDLPILSTSQPSLPSTPSSLPNSLNRVPDLHSLKQIHAHLIKTQTKQTLQLQNKLISLYSLFNHMPYAQTIFSKTPTKHSFSWNMMIRGFATHGPPQKALQFYSQMLHSSAQPDNFTYPFVLKSCSYLSSSLEAQEVHGRIIRTGLASDVYITTALIDFYGKFGEIENARKLFDEMPERTVVSCNAMIAGYVYNGLESEALWVFHWMVESGLEPNSSTMVSALGACAGLGALEEGELIHEWIVEKGIAMTNTVINSLITMYGRCGKLEISRRLFDKMSERTTASWTAIISAYAQNGVVGEAMYLFNQMQVLGEKLTAITLASVLPTCADLVDLKLGMKLHGYSIKNGFELDLVVGTAIVDMYAKCGCIEAACLGFDTMLEKNVVSWNAMIGAHGIHGNGKDALELFSRMRIEGIQPNRSTFVSLLMACSHAGLVREGWWCFELMSKEYKIVPETKHYACMVDLLGRAGHLKEAYEFIEKMPAKPDDVVWGALLGACRIYKNTELGEIAAKRIFELKPEEAGYHVLLANIYAAERKWEDALRIRETMRERKVKKEAGSSLIEHGGVVHSFIVGDFRHPEWEEIHSKMEEIGERLREEGYVPDTSFVLHEIEEVVKDERLSTHSERIALAFGLLKIGNKIPIRITKNLRICGDCHSAFKLVSRIYGREIIVRDLNRFHRFEDGVCSCKDYW